MGNSWKVPDDDDPNCKDPVDPESCPPDEENLYQSDSFCGLMTNQQGPFVKCHSVINPQGLFESCVVELCLLEGSQAALCNALEVYADACQSVGVTIPPWRNSTFCPIQCPTNSHYNVCANACAATCTDRLASHNCSQPCMASCECNEGFVLSGSTCVSVDDCGCFYNDKYYQVKTFWMDDCLERCRCIGNDQVKCKPATCESDEVCKIQDGILGCYSGGSATCHIYGDPHYMTFDRKLYHFQGACNYTVTETCGNTSVKFSVTTRNEHRGNPIISESNCLASGFEFCQGKTLGKFPYSTCLCLPCSNGGHELMVIVNERYKGELCGLCGTYTENQLDDFLKPDGILASDSNQFGNSWIVQDNSEQWHCNIHGNKRLVQNWQEADQYCKIFFDDPFKDCNWYIPPQLYFESCTYDYCNTGGDSEQLCNALASYASVCEAAGVDLGDWREQTGCVEESKFDIRKYPHLFSPFYIWASGSLARLRRRH
uniref:VWFD domain-containing protein n=1 Tax=Callorhinchus milii TaxID=7868 RepID=A0A4W3JFQ8_CALMI